MRRPGFAWLVAGVLWTTVACGGRREEPPQRQEPERSSEADPADEESGSTTPAGGTTTAQPAYTAIEVTNGGTLTGRVRWNGARPPMEAIAVTRSPEACGQTSPFPALVIGAEGGVQNTFVYIEGITRGRALPPASDADAPIIDQQSCVYNPHVSGIGVGRAIGFRNSDGVLHNVHATWSDDQTWFNIAQPTRGMTTRRTAERAGIARIVCDAGHTWMLSWVHVMPHPYFAVTDANGQFRIEGLPPGQYTVKAWHEGWRVTGQTSGRPTYSPPVILSHSATIAAGQEATVELDLSTSAPGA